MKITDMVSLDEVVELNRADAEFAEEWDRGTLARQLAAAVVRYRVEHKLTQRGLAKVTGLTQSAIARLETGDALPNLPTLVKLTKASGLTFVVEVSRGGAVLSAA